jgi:KipI family sensor histidine kinase inhibitor
VTPAFEPVFQPASDQALLIILGVEITLPVHHRVVQLLRAIEMERIQGVVNLHPAYCSLLIRFDSLRIGHGEIEARVRGLLKEMPADERAHARVVDIPVRYGGESGPDLNEVAELCGLTPPQVVDLHASVRYTVYFLGFVPGFAYMGQLPASLVVPRLPRPRTYVPAGSVAIANDHTAIYPMSTPGGWRVIGRTDVKLFDPSRHNLSLLQAGDEVRFCPIS